MFDMAPHLQQFDGPLAIYPPTAERFKQMLENLDWNAHFDEWNARLDAGPQAHGDGYDVSASGVATVPLNGVLSKRGSSLSLEGSTVRFRDALKKVRAAYDDGRVTACMVLIE